MKKIIYLIVLCSLASCSTNNCIKVFMKDEIRMNKEMNTASVLIDRKLNTVGTLEIYRGISRGAINSQAKSYNQNDYDMLYQKHRNDSLANDYWNKKESKYFNFSALIPGKEVWDYPLKDSLINLYSISKPIFIDSKKHALFSILKSKGPRRIIEDCVIIMKKEKGKWVFLEKVYSTALH